MICQHITLHTADTQNTLGGADACIDQGHITVGSVAVQGFQIISYQTSPFLTGRRNSTGSNGVAKSDQGNAFAVDSLVDHSGDSTLQIGAALVENRAVSSGCDSLFHSHVILRNGHVCLDTTNIDLVYAKGRSFREVQIQPHIVHSGIVSAAGKYCIGELEGKLIPAVLQHGRSQIPCGLRIVGQAGTGQFQLAVNNLGNIFHVQPQLHFTGILITPNISRGNAIGTNYRGQGGAGLDIADAHRCLAFHEDQVIAPGGIQAVGRQNDDLIRAGSRLGQAYLIDTADGGCADTHYHADIIQLSQIRSSVALCLCIRKGQVHQVPAALCDIGGNRPPQFFIIYCAGASDLDHAAGQLGNIVNVNPQLQAAFSIAGSIHSGEQAGEDQIACALGGDIVSYGDKAAVLMIGQRSALPVSGRRNRIDDAIELRIFHFRLGIGSIELIDTHVAAGTAQHRHDTDAVQLGHIREIRAFGVCGAEGQVQFIPATLGHIACQRPVQFFFIHGAGAGDFHHAAGEGGNIIHIQPQVQVALGIGG